MTPQEVDRLHEELQALAAAIDVEARDLRRDFPRGAAALHLLAQRARGLAAMLPDQTRPMDVGPHRKGHEAG